ncbi:MAG: DNA cytosine methyltransferase [Lachnospiraceae bacterium]
MRELGKDYFGKPVAIDTADYGIPQHRKRLVTVLSRNEHAKKQYLKMALYFLEATQPWITLRRGDWKSSVIESRKGKNKATGYDGLHKVPLLDAKNYFD